MEHRLAMSASPVTGFESQLVDRNPAFAVTSTESRPVFAQAISVGNSSGTAQAFTQISVRENGRALGKKSLVTTSSSLNFQALATTRSNQTVNTQPSFTWQNTGAPAAGAATLQTNGNNLTVRFSRAGTYQFRVTAGNVSTSFSVQVNAAFSGLDLSPNGVSLEPGKAQSYSARPVDQFGNTVNPRGYSVTWSATGGRIESNGRFTAGQQVGNYSVTASALGRAKTVQVKIQRPTITDTSLENMVNYFNQDQLLDRNEIIYMIKSTAQDNSVSSSEFNSLQYLLQRQSGFNMPDHVRSLATDVVFGNVANQRFQGTTLGNLRVGSNADQVNKLVDKWFYGTDLPAIGNHGSATYQWAQGALFNQTPKLQDSKQGSVGDCYFLASLASIAAKNPTAIQNMFIDNGDNTYTVRFYTGEYGYQFASDGSYTTGFTSGIGTATYLTVNRMLPGTSTGRYVFSNMGLSLSSTTTPIWLALAEKAYAQWNETGRADRDNTNRYEAISGGWMTDVNAQVLGRNSTAIWNLYSQETKASVIRRFQAGEAVTISTGNNVQSSDWVAGHAYVLSNYNAATDRFDLFNPWASLHRYNQTWEQLQANCDAIVVTDRIGSPVPSQGHVASRASSMPASFVWSSGSEGKLESKPIATRIVRTQATAVTVSNVAAQPVEFAVQPENQMIQLDRDQLGSKTDSNSQDFSKSRRDFDFVFATFDRQFI